MELRLSCTNPSTCDGNSTLVQVMAWRIWANVVWGLCHHDDVIKWKHLMRYWPFVPGIHRSPVNSPHKGQRRGALMFFICAWINDQRLCWWFESPSRSLWRHCNDVIIPYISVPFQMSEARTSCHEDEEAGSALHLSHHPRRAGPWRGKQSLCWQPGKPSQNPRGLHDTLLLQTEWQSGLWSTVRQHERRHPHQ